MAKREVGKSVNVLGVTIRFGFSWCWDPLAWHFPTKSGKHWVVCGLFYNPAPEGDTHVVSLVVGPLMFKLGWMV